MFQVHIGLSTDAKNTCPAWFKEVLTWHFIIAYGSHSQFEIKSTVQVMRDCSVNSQTGSCMIKGQTNLNDAIVNPYACTIIKSMYVAMTF